MGSGPSSRRSTVDKKDNTGSVTKQMYKKIWTMNELNILENKITSSNGILSVKHNYQLKINQSLDLRPHTGNRYSNAAPEFVHLIVFHLNPIKKQTLFMHTIAG